MNRCVKRTSATALYPPSVLSDGKRRELRVRTQQPRKTTVSRLNVPGAITLYELAPSAADESQHAALTLADLFALWAGAFRQVPGCLRPRQPIICSLASLTPRTPTGGQSHAELDS